MRLPQTGRPLVADATASDRDRAIAVLRRAVDLGVNHIDTAAFYFCPLRSANELITPALALPGSTWSRDQGGRRERCAVTRGTTPARFGAGRGDLRQLGRDHLDVVNLGHASMEPRAEYFGPSPICARPT